MTLSRAIREREVGAQRGVLRLETMASVRREGERECRAPRAGTTEAFTWVGVFEVAARFARRRDRRHARSGNYTAEADDNNGTGTALIEVYEVP